MNSRTTSFLSPDELQSLGFKSYGANVLISRYARFYGIEQMELGDHVRIDDFCILSGSVRIGSYVHISAFCALYGSKGIELADCTGLSPRVTVFSASDVFGGEFLIGPMIPEEFTNVQGEKVVFEKFVQMGAGSVVMPGVVAGEGSVAGAMSLIRENLEPWSMYAGIPARFIKARKKDLLDLYKRLQDDFGKH